MKYGWDGEIANPFSSGLVKKATDILKSLSLESQTIDKRIFMDNTNHNEIELNIAFKVKGNDIEDAFARIAWILQVLEENDQGDIKIDTTQWNTGIAGMAYAVSDTIHGDMPGVINECFKKTNWTLPSEEKLTDMRAQYAKCEKRNTLVIMGIDDRLKEGLSEIQSFYWLRELFPNTYLFVQDASPKMDEYFRLSHFLYFETIKNPNAVYYRNAGSKGNYQRLQTRNIGALTKFIPLIRIDMQMYRILACKVGRLWEKSEGNGLCISSDEMAKVVVEKIDETCGKFAETDWKRELRDLPLLAAYLYLAYQHYENGKGYTKDDWLRIFALETSDGVLQLIENVCMHSAGKTGYLSLTITKGTPGILHIGVTDVRRACRRQSEKYNKSIIYDRFYEHLENGKFKERFAYAGLKDFFQPEFASDVEDRAKDRFYGEDWDEYFYSNPDNAALHYGLHMFTSIVFGYEGRFMVRSGYGYRYEESQQYTFGMNRDTEDGDKSKGEVSFPGTSYRISLPLNRSSKQKNIGFNSKISNKSLGELNNYRVEQLDVRGNKRLNDLLTYGHDMGWAEQEDKIERIHGLQKCLDGYTPTKFDGNKFVITRIDFYAIANQWEIEYFCKALFLFIKKRGEAFLRIAIVNCPDNVMLEFIRWFLVFYDKQHRCKEMKNVEIYIVGEDGREDFLLSGSSLTISQQRVEKVCMSKGAFSHRQTIISQSVWRMNRDMHERAGHPVDEEFEIIPYDVLVDIRPGEKIFEDAVYRTLDTDIQSREFGCKVTDCHVRIGSKIHISGNFYEAHSLFHSNYYTSRFAYLVADRIRKNLMRHGNIYYDKVRGGQVVLIGYETYSELLVCEIKKILKATFGFSNVNHIIYDVANGDNFRLLKPDYINAHYINLVAINSTLSTHNKLISMYRSHGMDTGRIIGNFAIILIRDSIRGNPNDETAMSDLERDYWKSIDSGNRRVETSLVEKPIDYFIQIRTHWNSPLRCRHCFPEEQVDERPLIETNKASVVPAFMIGMTPEKGHASVETPYKDYLRKVNNKKLSPKIFDKAVLRYGHLSRNGNDYRYYIQSENLLANIERNDAKGLEEWCRRVKAFLNGRIPRELFDDILSSFKFAGIKSDNVGKYVNDLKIELEKTGAEITAYEAQDIIDNMRKTLGMIPNNVKAKAGFTKDLDRIGGNISNYAKEEITSYDIIVSPVHHSNAAWIDQITESVFDNMPIILHFDVQKQFRDNMKTEYSNLSMLYDNLRAMNREFEINFHFVDDTIVSGKTYHRARTLIQALFPTEAFGPKKNGGSPRVNLFKSVIVLFNRMSPASQLQYAKEGMFFSYVDISIPSLRNHEDACLLCKLVENMNKLKGRSATNLSAEYFEKREIKNQRQDELEYERKHAFISAEDEKRNYRRFFCNHIVFERENAIGDSRNDPDVMEKMMLELILEQVGCANGLEEQMEWLISFMKIYSRPVLTYRKSFLEAYLRVAITMMGLLLGNYKSAEGKLAGDYGRISDLLSKADKKNETRQVAKLLRALLAGLARVKSNYLLRKDSIREILDYYEGKLCSSEFPSRKFQERLVISIKKVIELSGDETKCIWTEHLVLNGNEYGADEADADFIKKYGIESDFGKHLYLENTRVIFDAVRDIYKNFYDSLKSEKENKGILVKELGKQRKSADNLPNYYLNNFFEFIKLDQDNGGAPGEESSTSRIAAMVLLYHKLVHKEMDSETGGPDQVDQVDDYYRLLLQYMKEASGASSVSLYGADAQDDWLRDIKSHLKSRYNHDDPEINKLLEVDHRLPSKLYRITTTMEEGEAARQEKGERRHAEELQLAYNHEVRNLYTLIGETVVLAHEDGRALVKIHNNYENLKEILDEYNVTKIPIEPFYFYFEFPDPEELSELGMLRGIRNVLTFRESIVKRIERDFNNNLIQLATYAQKKARDLSSDRAAGHTRMDEIKALMENGRLFEKYSETTDINGRYLGNMLKLLADSYCSHKFKEMYSMSEQPLRTKDVNRVYGLNEYRKILCHVDLLKKAEFSRVNSTSKMIEVARVDVMGLDGDSAQIINIEFDEVWLLVTVLLVQNAMAHGTRNPDTREFGIMIFRKGRYLVVRNQIGKKQKASEIRDLLEHVPESKSEGISLWVIDQCIRAAWRNYYWKMYIPNNGDVPKENIRLLMTEFNKLNKVCLKVESVEDKYLDVKVPIFFEEGA